MITLLLSLSGQPHGLRLRVGRCTRYSLLSVGWWLSRTPNTASDADLNHRLQREQPAVIPGVHPVADGSWVTSIVRVRQNRKNWVDTLETFTAALEALIVSTNPSQRLRFGLCLRIVDERNFGYWAIGIMNGCSGNHTAGDEVGRLKLHGGVGGGQLNDVIDGCRGLFATRERQRCIYARLVAAARGTRIRRSSGEQIEVNIHTEGCVNCACRNHLRVDTRQGEEPIEQASTVKETWDSPHVSGFLTRRKTEFTSRATSLKSNDLLVLVEDCG